MNNTIFNTDLISGKTNSTIVKISKLQNKKYRNDEKLFICDGVKLFLEAVEYNAIIRYIVLNNNTEFSTEIIDKIMSGHWLDFDVCITTPDMMGALGRCARILGPKGLMPNPKSGTVTMDVTKAINDVKAGKVEYRLDKQNIVHVRIGKVSFGAERLLNNLTTVMDAIIKAKPAAAKGTYLKSVYVATTMGPSVKVAYDVK